MSIYMMHKEDKGQSSSMSASEAAKRLSRK